MRTRPRTLAPLGPATRPARVGVHQPARLPSLPDFAQGVVTPCQTHPDPDLWFAPLWLGRNAPNPRIAAAKALCMTCPVVAACGSHAIAAREPHGVWGGLDERDRERIRRARRWEQVRERAG